MSSYSLRKLSNEKIARAWRTSKAMDVTAHRVETTYHITTIPYRNFTRANLGLRRKYWGKKIVLGRGNKNRAAIPREILSFCSTAVGVLH